MTLSVADIENNEHEAAASAKKVVIHGKTSGDVYVEFLVQADGTLEIT